MEKKHILIALAAIMLVVGSIFTVRAVRERHSDVFFETMLEALVSSEFAGEPCYKAVRTGVSMWVIYCDECDRLTKGEPIPWEGMDTCR